LSLIGHMRKIKMKVTERKCVPSKSGVRFLLSGTPPGGKRVREYFPSRAAAEKRKTELEADITRAGFRSVNLSADERREVADLKASLAPFNKSLADAVTFYREHLERLQKESSVTVSTSYGMMLDAKAANGFSARYLADLKEKCGRFTRKFGTRPCSSITTVEVRKWLASLKLRPVSHNDYRRVIHTFFSYAVNEGFCSANPVAKVDIVKEVQAAPGTIRADALPGILRHIRQHSPAMLPAFAIQAFAGLRTAEVCNLRWEDIRIEDGIIEVNALSAKNSVRRPVQIEKNLLPWLVASRQPTGNIAAKNYVRQLVRLNDALEAEGLPPFPHNALRHSYGTYHCARYDSTHTTADQMGNSPAVVKAHYRAVASKRDAEKWFAVTPESLDAALAVPIPFTPAIGGSADGADITAVPATPAVVRQHTAAVKPTTPPTAKRKKAA
jgi:integrase